MFVLALDSDEECVQAKDICREQGSTARRLGNTRSSPHLSVVALGCLNVRGERGKRQSCYSDRLGQRPSTDTVKE
jgi:hypothetical protein